MIVSPGAKINLGLYITAKRSDGFHDLLTFFYPIPFSDSLEIIPMSARTQITDSSLWAKKLPPAEADFQPSDIPGLPIKYSASGLPVQGSLESNLCVKAYKLLKTDYPALLPVAMHLHKSVPMGAGLGGGSADGAATLKILNQLGNLQLSEKQLHAYADKLGSDCPFFIKNEPQVATGKGEILVSAPLSLEGYTLLLVCPHIHVPTATAFKQIKPQAGPTREILLQIIGSGPENWSGQLHNQFEHAVFRQFPAIKEIKQTLYDLGAAYASMTGSGSSVFGIFKTANTPVKEALLPFENYYVGSWQL